MSFLGKWNRAIRIDAHFDQGIIQLRALAASPQQILCCPHFLCNPGFDEITAIVIIVPKIMELVQDRTSILFGVNLAWFNTNLAHAHCAKTLRKSAHYIVQELLDSTWP